MLAGERGIGKLCAYRRVQRRLRVAAVFSKRRDVVPTLDAVRPQDVAAGIAQLRAIVLQAAEKGIVAGARSNMSAQFAYVVAAGILFLWGCHREQAALHSALRERWYSGG
jgi:hypothetical protein